jgi:GT2 family glycosyltransferase
VTLIVTQRERMSLTERSLESVLSDHTEPFSLIYVDGGAHERVHRYLERRVAEVRGLLIRRPDWLWPNVARNLALPHVETEYVVFIDNDVVIEPGWLARLVASADQACAALVGPLYLWSDGTAEPRIHMAGGTLTTVETASGRALHERHDLINAAPSERAKLARRTCDFLEYHCMLARTNFLRRVGGLSEDVVCVHEHIDVALEAKAVGLPVIFEPAAAVTQLALAPYLLADLPFHRWR